MAQHEVYGKITEVTGKEHYYITAYSITATVKNTVTVNPEQTIYYNLFPRGVSSGIWWYTKKGYVYAGDKLTGTYDVGRSLAVTDEVYIEYNTTYYNNINPGFTVTGARVYGSKAPFTAQASFKGGYMRPDVANSITFTADKLFNVKAQYTIKSGKFYYKKTSDTAYSNISFTGSKLSIPANTLVTGQTYDAYATVTADDNTTTNVSFSEISTVDAIPTVKAIAPINQVLYGTATFEWNYNISTGTAQRAYDIQGSPSGQSGTWYWIAQRIYSSAQKYTATLTESGMIYWRVRVYNQDMAVSAWSTVNSFINNIPPKAPTITEITAAGRPVVSWETGEQMAYQVQILQSDEVLEDSGAVYSGGKTYQAEDYLTDGAYTVRVRIYNVYGVVSNWATSNFTIASSLPAPVFTVSAGNPGLYIEITHNDVFSKYYILRDGVPIGETTSDTYADLYANGQTTYTVIGVTSDDNDAMATQTVNISATSNILIDLSGNVYRINRRLASPVGVQYSLNAVFDTAEYIGARLPDHHFAKMREARFTVTFKDYVDIDEMLGQTLYYADMYGNGAFVCITSIGRTESRFGNETTAELQVTRHDERIKYA